MGVLIQHRHVTGTWRDCSGVKNRPASNSFSSFRLTDGWGLVGKEKRVYKLLSYCSGLNSEQKRPKTEFLSTLFKSGLLQRGEKHKLWCIHSKRWHQFVQSGSSPHVPDSRQERDLTKEPQFVSEPFLREVICVPDLKHLWQISNIHQYVFTSCVHHLQFHSASCWTGEDEAEWVRNTTVVMFVFITVDNKSWLSFRKFIL